MNRAVESNPWWTVLATATGLVVGGGALANYAFGVLLKEIAAERGWERGLVSGGIALFMVAIALGTSVLGCVIDRRGLRLPSLISVVLFAAVLASLSLFTSPVVFLTAFAFMGFLGGGTTPLPYSKAIALKFEARRGLALGIGTSGLGIGGIVLPQYASFLGDRFDAGGGFVGLAAAVLLLAVPAMMFGLPGGPVQSSDTVRGTPSARTVVRREFWTLAFAVFLIAGSVGGATVHAVALMTDRGMLVREATTALSLAGLAALAGRVVTGFLMDVFFAPRLIALVFLTATAGMCLLLWGEAPSSWVLGIVCVGVVLGAEVDAISYLVSRYFPLESFGTIYGVMLFVFALGNASGTFFLGVSHDAWGSYSMGLGVSAICALLASTIIATLGPYRQQQSARVEVDTRETHRENLWA